MNKTISFLLKNKVLKLISLALAIATWFYVSAQEDKQSELQVPLTLRVPEGKFLLEPSTRPMLTLVLRGPTRAVTQFREEALYADISITDKVTRLPDTSESPQPITIQIGPEDIQNVPDNMTVRSIEPQRISILIDELTRKRLDVEVDPRQDLKGELQEGYRIHRISPVPNKVMVQGPRSILARRQTIRPLPLDISGLGPQPWNPTIQLDRGDTETGLRDCLSPEPPEVQVWFFFTRPTIERTFEQVPIIIHAPPGFNYTVLDAQTHEPLKNIPEVTIRGPENLLQDNGVVVRAIVNLAEVDPAGTPEVEETVRYVVGPRDPDASDRVRREIAEEVELPTGPEVLIRASPISAESED